MYFNCARFECTLTALVLSVVFRKAVKICWEEFSDHVHDLLSNWVPSRNIVMEAMKTRLEDHSSGRILRIRRSRHFPRFECSFASLVSSVVLLRSFRV